MKHSTLSVACGVLTLASALHASARQRVDDLRVQRLLERAVVIDLHSDTSQRILDEGIVERNRGTPY